MNKITNWTARRAGGRITIKGFTELGDEVKVVGVDTIACDAASTPIIATDRDGKQYQLVA